LKISGVMMQMNFLPVRLGLSAAALVGGLAMATHASAVVIKTTTPISIPQTIDGIYINLVTGATSLTPITGFDIDPYATATGLGFYFAGDATNGGVISGTAYVDLAVVGPASTFSQSAQTAAAVNFQTAGTHVLGVRFLNEGTGATNYGYLTFQISGGAGFPASLVTWSYENSGAAITVSSPVPEPASAWMLLAGGLMLAGAAARRR
jgi:hypothetical protein